MPVSWRRRQLISPLTLLRPNQRRRRSPTTDGRKPELGLGGAEAGLGLRRKSIGARVKRVEDRRLLTGRGSFTDDRIVLGALHVAFRRGDHAHALISGISTTAAAATPGVFGVYTAQDFDDLVEPVRAPSRMKDVGRRTRRGARSA
jgi:Aldehyde oxidase and xanthine dehydrogenase, a/b hammerhead domain